MTDDLRLLLLEDQDDDVALILRALKKGGLQVRAQAVQTRDGFLAALGEGPWDCILSDFGLPGFDGRQALLLLREQDDRTPFILVSGAIGDELAAELMRQGANDFVRKDRLERLVPAIERELREAGQLLQRRQAEEGLRASEERFRKVSSSMMDIAYSCIQPRDGGPTIDWMVGATQPILGRSLEEVIAGKCWGRFVLPEDLGLFSQHLLELRPGQAATCELRVQKPDGGVTWLESHARCEEAAEPGVMHRIFGALVDISARKRAEAVLQETLLFNELIISSVREGVIVYDRDLRYQVWNPFMEQISGLPAAAVLGRQPLEVFPFLADTEVLANLQAALLGEPHRPMDIPFRVPATGRSGWSTHSNAPFRNATGEIVGVIATISDITERKRQELEIRRVNRLYNLISQLGQCLARVEGRQELFDAFCAIAVQTGGYPLVWVGWLDPASAQVEPVARAGASHGYLDGISVLADLSPEGQGPAGTCIREDRTVVCQDLLDAPAMSPWRVRAETHQLRAVAAFPIHLEGRAAGSFMVYGREPEAFLAQEIHLLEKAAADISFGLDRFSYEGEKAKLQAQLLQVQKMESLGTLAGGIAHDMNNVLGAILGLASARLLAEPEGAPNQAAFATIAKAASRGGEMVKGLLSFARQTQAQEGDVNLNSLFQDMVHLLERTTLAKVRLELALAEDLASIRGDAGALTNAFMNLCVNAVDAMPDTGTLTLRSRNLGTGWVEARVEDTGTGMPPEVAARAMEPFFTTKAQGKGTGLGLAMVYSTVQAHHGELEILSEPGRGTCVVARFPAYAAEAGAPARAPELRADAAPRPLRVLVVDDDELILESMAMLLDIMGHAVDMASSGEQALALLEAGLDPDVVILDLNMPGLGGPGTLPRLRRLRPELPVLLATGNADHSATTLVASDPGTSLLNKPFSFQELKNQLERRTGARARG